jgi:DnaJ-class molecular chaperone
MAVGEVKEQCPRCAGKREVACPECKGTGDARNESWVVIGTCKACAKSKRKGFVVCPRCKGTGFATSGETPPPPDTKKW